MYVCAADLVSAGVAAQSRYLRFPDYKLATPIKTVAQPDPSRKEIILACCKASSAYLKMGVVQTQGCLFT